MHGQPVSHTSTDVQPFDAKVRKQLAQWHLELEGSCLRMQLARNLAEVIESASFFIIREFAWTATHQRVFSLLLSGYDPAVNFMPGRRLFLSGGQSCQMSPCRPQQTICKAQASLLNELDKCRDLLRKLVFFEQGSCGLFENLARKPCVRRSSSGR